MQHDGGKIRAGENTLLMQMYQPLNMLGSCIARSSRTGRRRADVSPDRVAQEIADRPGAPRLVVHAGECAFEDVHFGYAGPEILFNPSMRISFSIPPGRSLAIVAPPAPASPPSVGSCSASTT